MRVQDKRGRLPVSIGSWSIVSTKAVPAKWWRKPPGPASASFLGLHYPASDIPVQARALYLRNLFRIIADVDAVPVPILPPLDEHGRPLDLSMSVLRSVSPIHIEYLKNMGVGASLSISIVVDGRLWGLFACHHYGPRLPSAQSRSTAELFGQMFVAALKAANGDWLSTTRPRRAASPTGFSPPSQTMRACSTIRPG